MSLFGSHKSWEVIELLPLIKFLSPKTQETPPTYVFLVILINVADVLEDLLVTQGLVGLFSGECQDLPQGDCKRPHVALGREFALRMEDGEGQTEQVDESN